VLLPKKVSGRVNPAGMAERRALLCNLGLARGFLEHAPPRGAAADDFLDAAALLFIAARHTRGEAEPFPDPPGVDAHGVPIAIWV
jgi:predicted RNase H-like nuclease